MGERTVLISGASIAGPALAFWLNRYGFRVVVVERAGALRRGGQNVDVEDAARTVVRRMGIEGDIRAATTGEKGVRFVDDHDGTVGELPAATADGGFAMTAELEILRGDLAAILYERTREDVEYVFGDWITGLRDGEDRITASFAHGAERDVDLVIAADGFRSRTRRLIVGDEPVIRPIGLSAAYLTIPRGAGDSGWARWYHATRGRSVFLRPDNVGTTRALLLFRSPPSDHERLTLPEQREILRRTFADVGWEAPRVLAALADADDMYFDSFGQVLAPRWSCGRGALLGDAGFCPSPMSGTGSSLALVAAYVLAGELGRTRDHREAFAAYERIMRPYVSRAQKLPPGSTSLLHPRTRVGVEVLRACARVACSPLVRRVVGRFQKEPAETFDLPDYA